MKKNKIRLIFLLYLSLMPEENFTFTNLKIRELEGFSESNNKQEGKINTFTKTQITLQSKDVALKPAMVIGDSAHKFQGTLFWQNSIWKLNLGHFQERKNLGFWLSNNAYLPNTESTAAEIPYGLHLSATGDLWSIEVNYFQITNEPSLHHLFQSNLGRNLNFGKFTIKAAIGVLVCCQTENWQNPFAGIQLENLRWHGEMADLALWFEFKVLFYRNQLPEDFSHAANNLFISTRWNVSQNSKEFRGNRWLLDIFVSYFQLDWDFLMANGLYRQFQKSLVLQINSPILKFRSYWSKKRNQEHSNLNPDFKNGINPDPASFRGSIGVPLQNFQLKLENDEKNTYTSLSYRFNADKIQIEPFYGFLSQNQAYDLGLFLANGSKKFLEFSAKLLWRMGNSATTTANFYALENEADIEDKFPLFLPQSLLIKHSGGFSFLLNAGKFRLFSAFMAPISTEAAAKLWFVCRLQASITW